MDRDLFGNNIEQKKELTSIQRMTARQADFEGRDLYTTEPKDILRFLMAAKRDSLEILSPIWEPAAGHGDISKTLSFYDYSVISSDIMPYRDKDIEIPALDFFTCNKLIDPKIKTIFTNPPFNCQEDFILHALSFNVDVIFFVRTSFLSSIKRYSGIFAVKKPTYIYHYTLRASCYKNGDVSKNKNMIDYIMIVWKPPYNREPITRWIE
jgi:hypothetical protein